MKKLEKLAKEGRINENASIKDSHSTIINAPIDEVWKTLSDLERWPEWNEVIKKVSIDGELKVGTKFKWTFDGNKFSSEIHSATAPTTLAWTGKSSWIKSVYVWQLVADDNQTIATLSNSMEGTFIVLINKHQKVYDDIIGWLGALKDKAEEGAK